MIIRLIIRSGFFLPAGPTATCSRSILATRLSSPCLCPILPSSRPPDTPLLAFAQYSPPPSRQILPFPRAARYSPPPAGARFSPPPSACQIISSFRPPDTYLLAPTRYSTPLGRLLSPHLPPPPESSISSGAG